MAFFRLCFSGFLLLLVFLSHAWAKEFSVTEAPVDACSPKGLAKKNLSDNLIENGSFENPQLTHGSWAVFTKINGWTTIAGPGIEIQNNAAGASFDGTQFVELDSHANSMFEQIVPIKPQRNYCLKFAYSPRPGVEMESQGIRVWLNKKVVKIVKRQGTGLFDTQWQDIYVNWTSPSSATFTSLWFEAYGKSDGTGGYLDAVEMYVLPP